MKNYSTITEKAAEWDISTRHIQYLCRTGKIKGAVKRAGVWFIPENTPIPAKNTKSDAKDFKFVGTKSKIFDSAIELFLSKNFTNVSFKDIANSVGIRQSTIYNHFKSKQEILDTIYDFYCHFYLKERLTLDDMEPVLRKGNIIDIIGCIRYEFKEDYLKRMSDITGIIFQRICVDDRAREIAKSLMVDEGIKYVEDIFNHVIKSGRIAPFDTHIMAVFINIVRIFTLYYWVIEPSPDNRMKLLEDEQMLYTYAARFLTDLYLQNS